MKEYFAFFKMAGQSLLFILILTGCNDSNSSTSDDNKDVIDTSKIDIIDAEVQLPVVKNDDLNAENLVNTKDASKLNAAQMSIQKLLESCVKDKYDEAAKVIMYRGADESRMGQDSFNYLNANEANTVRVTCEVIKSWLGASQSYDFISYQEEESEFGMQYAVEIMFKKEKLGVERHFFYLMNTPKGMMLVDMI
jgi:hypothetical protein